ncbi:PREDICTED: uncharacterized protein LOC105560178 [Vollenhovia emeryi]|uniref:uncharacterized protein LOC105560178 n=1 Tax=Vollenhovia emeryi TaxID=411798 RepID=UPI0005F36731|nr:PREDICTED: uncharacterized protein LOC105560178 [Vollenhovia emeryi]
MIKTDKKEKAKSIIFNHIMKNPEAQLSEIYTALTHYHKITVSSKSVYKWVGECKKRIAASPGQPQEEVSDLVTEQHLEKLKQKQQVCKGTLEKSKCSQKEDIYV